MFNRFQNKLVILFVALFVIVQGVTYSSVYFATTNNLEAQASEQLQYGGTVFSQALKTSTDKWRGEANLYSTDFGFISAVTTDDNATIVSALENLSSRIGADRAMLVSLDTEVIAEISDDPERKISQELLEELIIIADEEGDATAFLNLGEHRYQYTFVPVLAPVPVAWVGVGVVIDGNSLNEIKKTLPVGIDITLIDHSSAGAFIKLESTMTGNGLDVDLQSAAAINSTQTKLYGDNDYRFMAHVIELPSAIEQNTIQALLTYSLDEAYSPYEPLMYLLIVLLGLGIIVLVGGSMTVARSVSKPLQVLANAAHLIQIGHYRKITSIDQKDEIGQLTDHFNQMIIGIQDREEQIIYQAEHDLETGLPNRKSLEKYLNILYDNQKDTGQMFSILQITVERFDDIRNTLGYETSRGLLNKIGIRLLRLATTSNFVARLGTASFCFIIEGGNNINAVKLAREICAKFEEAIVVDDFPIDTNISIGISCCPEHAESAELLVQRASIAALHAKDTIDHICVYNQKIDRYDPDHLSLMGDFKKSLDEGDVRFYYQPKIDLKLGHITHVEALVRWIHPERGFIPPDDFITLAEQTGHIHHLTSWGLDAAISQCRIWMSEGIDLKVAINLSARDLSNRKLPDIIIKLLQKYGVPRTALVLEVTENAIMQDPDLALGVLNALDQQGLLLSIDDYGTGYSSMSYLKQLPVKELKIDKSFVLDLASNKDDEILVRSTIDLAHNLGLKVTAEGIEDQESLDILRELGCDLIQGFYISKPVPVDELYDFLANSPYGLPDFDLVKQKSPQSLRLVSP